MSQKIKRHPIKGLFGGLFLGLGLSIFAMVFDAVIVGSIGAIGIIVAGTLLGVVIAYVLPPKGGKAAGGASAATPPAAPAAPQPS